MADPDRRRLPVSREAWLAAQDLAGRIYRQRVDASRLEDDDVRRLCDLVGLIAIPHGVDLDKLSRSERGDLERLIARGAGLDDDHFSKRRERAQRMTEQAEQTAKKRKLPLTRRQQTNVFQVLYQGLADDDLWLDDVSVIAALLCMWSAGKTLDGVTFFTGEGDDLTFHLNASVGFLGRTGSAGNSDNWRDRLIFLGEERWLRIERRGPEWAIRLGDRLKAAFETEVSV
jgi:hypothetical protein